MGLLKLYVDVQNNRLVVSDRNPSQFLLPAFVQGDVIPVELFLLEPNTSGGLSSPLSLITGTQYTVKIGIVTPHPVSPVASSVVTLSADASWASNGKYTGSLSMGAGITTLLGATATSVTSTFEVELASAGDYRTPIQMACTVKAAGIASGTPDTAAGDTFPTHGEANATYVPKAGASGGNFTLKSADGTKQILIFCGDDGTLHADPIS